MIVLFVLLALHYSVALFCNNDFECENLCDFCVQHNCTFQPNLIFIAKDVVAKCTASNNYNVIFELESNETNCVQKLEAYIDYGLSAGCVTNDAEINVCVLALPGTNGVGISLCSTPHNICSKSGVCVECYNNSNCNETEQCVYGSCLPKPTPTTATTPTTETPVSAEVVPPHEIGSAPIWVASILFSLLCMIIMFLLIRARVQGHNTKRNAYGSPWFTI